MGSSKQTLPSGTEFRCGFAAVVGRPNVGKSTLVNALLGEKVSIVTPKPQTTRTRIHGILNLEHAQLILVDTPGLCQPGRPIANALRRVAGSAALDSDLTVVVVEARSGADVAATDIPPADHDALSTAAQAGRKIVLVINKVDRIGDKRLLLSWIQRYTAQYELAAVVPMSALRQDGLELLVRELVALLPVGPPLFPTDQHTDQAERVLCAELVREQLLMRLQQEVPHSTAVIIETFEDLRDSPKPMCRLEGRIVVDRVSQRGIIVGKGGEQIKAISSAARREMEELLGSQVYLRLEVHVVSNWTRNPQAMRRLGIGGGEA